MNILRKKHIKKTIGGPGGVFGGPGGGLGGPGGGFRTGRSSGKATAATGAKKTTPRTTKTITRTTKTTAEKQIKKYFGPKYTFPVDFFNLLHPVVFLRLCLDYC